ncbi:MAG TPA: hypothetical protein VGI76_10215 [Solirubrobacteraceae bacterium]|jgi:hypothetical protein
MPTPGRPTRFRVAFDAALLAEDANHSTPKARTTLNQAVRDLSRHGITTSRLKACQDHGQDGTRLPGCAKTYLPAPDGPWGMVFQLRIDPDNTPFLACLAFGARHPSRPWQPSVYQTAHQRLHT